MKVEAKGFGYQVPPNDLKPGDVFTADYSGKPAVCLLLDDPDETLFLVLQTALEHSEPLPALKDFGYTLRPPFLLVPTSFEARPVKRSDAFLFPRPANAATHGNLILSDHEPFVFIVSGDRKAAYSLYTGQRFRQHVADATVFGRWSLFDGQGDTAKLIGTYGSSD